MRVGFFLTHYEPESGGAYTFQNAIYQALKAIDTTHQFYFFFNTLDGKAMRETVDVVWFISPNYQIVDDVPYIYTLWDLQHRLQPYFPEVSSNGEWLTREQVFTIALKRASLIVVGTEAGKQEVMNLYELPHERVRVIPLPAPEKSMIADDAKDEAVIASLGLHTPYIFYPAQFWPHKNHIRILQAVKRLQEQYGLTFSVAFTGSDKGNATFLQQMAGKMQLQDNVFFLGFVAHDVVDCLYRKAFALVFSSFFGPDNFPPLEAFSWGCPVIASRIPGAQEQLGNAAVLFDPKSEVELANCILQLYQHSEVRESLIQLGYAQNEQIGSADAYVRKVITVLDEFEPIRQCWGS